MILNITPDHLDRHGTFENYVATKERIFASQTAEDFLVLNGDDPRCAAGRKPHADRRSSGSAAARLSAAAPSS